MKNLKSIQQILRRNAYFALAMELALGLTFPIISLGTAFASSPLAQVTYRSLTMSDSSPSGGTITTGVGSGTTVSYELKFNVASTSDSIGGIVVDFCSNSALPFDTCTAPTGFNSNYASNTVANQANMGAGAFSVDTSATSEGANRIFLTRATAATMPTNSTTLATIDIGNGTTSGFTNPSGTPGTFYARIYLYPTQTAARAHVPATDDGNSSEFGGVAMSTANVITITARVQEQLIFCVSAAAPTANCGGTSLPSLQIGHTSGGSALIIDSTAVNTANAYLQLSTNAVSGATVRMHSSTTCGGLSSDGGTTCGIPPSASGAATPATITAGTPAFGMYVGASNVVGGGSGTITPDPNYNDGTSTHYGMDSTSSGTNVTTTYGDSIASCSAPISDVNSPLTFAATAANSTAAGLYSANLSLVATGKF